MTGEGAGVPSLALNPGAASGQRYSGSSMGTVEGWRVFRTYSSGPGKVARTGPGWPLVSQTYLCRVSGSLAVQIRSSGEVLVMQNGR